MAPDKAPAETALTLSDLFVGNVAFAETTLPGEYVAWHVGTSGRAGAYGLGLSMLPSLGAPKTQRVYNDNERSAGAMLLALAARTPAQKEQAVERITSRLSGSATVGGEDNFHVAGSYKCALAILGLAQYQQDVLGLLETREFPQRRALTALGVTGRKEALDWVLWNPQIPIEQIDFLLVAKGIHEVFEVVAPQLPTIDLAAPNEVRLWQIQILRDTYILRRAGVTVGLAR